MNPILSIDVSKNKSVAAAYLDMNQPIFKPKVFSHTTNHLHKLIAELRQIKQTYGYSPKIVMEATGNYSRPLAQFFYLQGFEVFVLNPLMTHAVKRKAIRKIKTDPIDVHRIAHAFYTGHNLYAYEPQDDVTTALKELTRQYDSISTLASEAHLQLLSTLDLVFPNYGQLFSNIRNKASLSLLTAFPTPELVLNASINDIAEVLMPSFRPLSWRIAKAEKIVAAASECIAIASLHNTFEIIIRSQVQLLVQFDVILEELRFEMKKIARLSQHYNLLLSIPGVGEITASIILSEIGNIKRFKTKKQLTAYAGLDPSIFQSGKFTASNNKISKRGSPYLRKALYQATFIGIGKRGDHPVNPILHEYYMSKKSQGKHGKVALVATCSKLLNMIYGILSTETPYQNQLI